LVDTELKRRLIPRDPRIFLTYARLDDEVPTLDRDAKGWVRYLYDQLQLALRQRLGDEVEFWRDRKDIDENCLFEHLIEEGLEGSTLLLAVVSPSYIKSTWCQREWQLFIKKCGSESRETIERVVKVLKHRMDEANLPPPLQNREGYRFFAPDPDHPRREVPFYLNGKMRREAEYLDVLERLVNYLVERLEDAPPARAGAVRTGLRIFLAVPQGADTTEPTLRVRKALEEAGLSVIAPPASPVSEAAARGALRETLRQTNAAIHIIGCSAGVLLRNGQLPAVHLQLEESGRWSSQQPDFRRYILLLASHAKGKPEHLSFIDRLQQDLDEGGLLQLNDSVIIEQPGGMTVQEFIQIALDGLSP